MGFALAPSAIADGYRIEAHDSVGSTNALALDHARAGSPGGLWVVTDCQKSGRGRRGRAWSTPPGSLAATLLLVENLHLSLAATLGFVAGLSLGEALENLVPGRPMAIAADAGSGNGDRFELKWPNDVLAGGAKLAGILLESTLLGDGRVGLAIGIGVNVVAHPEGLSYPATSLHALGATIDAGEVFLALSDAWVRNWRRWDAGRGLGDIRRRWLARAAGLGSPVSVLYEGDIVRGVFETIDDDCRFVIRSGSRLIRIAAGDVHFGAVASA
jgi:BirA family biotin operon repressor/biotin-[acetyl-CoA-carboxylase] ligase